MNTTSRVVLRWPVFLVVAIACMAAGAAGTYWIVRSPARPAPAGADHAISHGTPQAEPHENHGAATASDRLADVNIELTPEAMERAGIVVATVAAGDPTPVAEQLPGCAVPVYAPENPSAVSIASAFLILRAPFTGVNV